MTWSDDLTTHIEQLRARLHTIKHRYPSTRKDFWINVAAHAHLHPRSVINFAYNEPAMLNPGVQTLQALDKALDLVEADLDRLAGEFSEKERV